MRPKKRTGKRTKPAVRGIGRFPEKRAFAAALFIVLLLGGLLIRCAFLSADPPDTISWSQGPFTDGAVVVHDARSKVLFGEWIVDYSKDLYLFPLSNIVTWPVFRAFGVGRWQAAFPNTVLAALSLAAMSLGIAAFAGRGRALFWLYLATFNYFLIMFQRIPIAEPAMIFFLTLSFLLFAVRGKWRWALAASGFFAMAAPLFGKAHAYYFPAVLLLTLSLTGEDEGRKRRIVEACAGMGAALLLWLTVLFIPQWGHIRDHIAHESYGKHEGGLPGMVREFLQNLIGMGTYTKVFERMPVLMALAFASVAGFLLRGKKIVREEPPAAVFLFFWVVIGWAAIALVRLPAPRYLSALVFPLLYFSVRSLAALAGGKKAAFESPGGRAGALLGALLLLFAVYQPVSTFGTRILERFKFSSWGSGIYRLFVQEERYTELVFFCLVLSAAIVLVLLALTALRKDGGREVRLSLPVRSGVVLAACLVAVSLFLNMGNWYYWGATRSYYLRDASRDLTDWLGPNARLMGSYAPTLGLDNTIPVFPYFGGLGETDVFRKHGITHVVIVSQGDHAEVREKYPEYFERWQMVLSYPLRCRYSDTIGIFRLPSRIGDEQVNDYEPSLFEQAVDRAKEHAWEEALRLLLQFTKEKPRNADGHYLVGFMYNELGRVDESIRAIRKSIALRDQRPYYYFKLGDIFANIGRTAEARRYLEIANSLNPRDTDVQSALDMMRPGAGGMGKSGGKENR